MFEFNGFKRIIFFKRWTSGYPTIECEALLKLDKLYRTYFISEDLVNYKNLFTQDPKKRCPLASSQEIDNCFTFEEKNNTGYLKLQARHICQTINVAVNQREKDVGCYINSAATLFLADFARWSNDLAKKNVTKQLMQEINQRISYLNDIEKENIFQLETKADHATDIIIWNIKNYLQEEVLKLVEAELSYESAREKFKKLTSDASDYLNYIVKALLHIFTDQYNLKDNFSLDNLETLDSKIRQILDKTYLGYCIKNLKLKNETYQIFNKEGNENIIHLLNPNISEELKKSVLANVHKDIVSKPLMASGISKFIKTDMISTFIKILILLENYSSLINVFYQAYHLSGCGGNILMYIGLCNEITDILSCHHQLVLSLKSQFAIIQNESKTIYENFIRKRESHPWKNHYLTAENYFKIANRIQNDCSTTIYEISSDMNKIFSSNYENSVSHQINKFKKDITQIYENTNQLTNTSLRSKNLDMPKLKDLNKKNKKNIQNSEILEIKEPWCIEKNEIKPIQTKTNENLSILALIERAKKSTNTINDQNNSTKNFLEKETFEKTII